MSVKDIEKIAIDSLPEKPGIYHIRFLEIVLRTLQPPPPKNGRVKDVDAGSHLKKKKKEDHCLWYSLKSRYSIFDVTRTF